MSKIWIHPLVAILSGKMMIYTTDSMVFPWFSPHFQMFLPQMIWRSPPFFILFRRPVWVQTSPGWLLRPLAPKRPGRGRVLQLPHISSAVGFVEEFWEPHVSSHMQNINFPIVSSCFIIIIKLAITCHNFEGWHIYHYCIYLFVSSSAVAPASGASKANDQMGLPGSACSPPKIIGVLSGTSRSTCPFDITFDTTRWTALCWWLLQNSGSIGKYGHDWSSLIWYLRCLFSLY